MADKYSLQEIVKFAIEIEKEGILFYNKISKKTKNQGLKNIFLKLEIDEKKHQKSHFKPKRKQHVSIRRSRKRSEKTNRNS